MALMGSALYGSALAAPNGNDITHLATVTVSLVFANNDTYAPGPVFPMVWAIHNLHTAALSCAMTIEYHLYNLDDPNATDRDWVEVHILFLDEYAIDPIYNNASLPPDQRRSNPFFLTTISTNLNTSAPAARYSLSWTLSAIACYPGMRTIDGDRHYLFEQIRSTKFTITPSSGNNGEGKNPLDLSPTQSNSTCHNWTSFAFAVTEALPIPADDVDTREMQLGRSLCAVIPDPAPGYNQFGEPLRGGIKRPIPTTTGVPRATVTVSGDPCLGVMDEKAASSVSAAVTRLGCEKGVMTEGCDAAAAPTGGSGGGGKGGVGRRRMLV
ncbi:hypothetical protein VTJ04DRAFT_9684 [Mycothermus thermophilus]|uniref:uncharacterized protein n=1 Tax=Humicola insolens TaxID=85995 RepID=UPI00374472C7